MYEGRWSALNMQAYKGLSRMRGNLHVRFLGGGGTVMFCCYPTFIAQHNYLKRLELSPAFSFFGVCVQEITWSYYTVLPRLSVTMHEY